MAYFVSLGMSRSAHGVVLVWWCKDRCVVTLSGKRATRSADDETDLRWPLSSAENAAVISCPEELGLCDLFGWLVGRLRYCTRCLSPAHWCFWYVPDCKGLLQWRWKDHKGCTCVMFWIASVELSFMLAACDLCCDWVHCLSCFEEPCLKLVTVPEMAAVGCSAGRHDKSSCFEEQHVSSVCMGSFLGY